MLESLDIINVGPSHGVALEFSPRINMITGDNGLGKSLILDVAWWALTCTWARQAVIPQPGVRASISSSYTKNTKTTKGYHTFISKYDRENMLWPVQANRPTHTGLVLYAQGDGGFSVWDPVRNYWTEGAPNASLFTSNEVLTGNKYCKGLINDWALWQAGNDPSFCALRKVLEILSPSPEKKIEPGDLRKLTVNDPRRYPTLRGANGEDTAVIHASAGVRRVLALAYLTTWAWQEHVESVKLRGEEETSHEIVFLIDDIEDHLHPLWQRTIVSTLTKVMEALTGMPDFKVQLITSTHSPLVMASLEPFFDAAKDSWFAINREDRAIVLRKHWYGRLGEVGNWLVSDAFDLKEPRSLEGERAVRAGLQVLNAKSPSLVEIEAADKLLCKAGLPDIDLFWVHWDYFVEQARQPAAPKGEPCPVSDRSHAGGTC